MYLPMPIPELADPSFVTSQQIHMIIGAGLFFELLCNEKFKHENDGLYYQKTHLGWVVSGLVQSTLSNNTNIVALVSTEANNEIFDEPTIEQQITKFWCIEECSINEV